MVFPKKQGMALALCLSFACGWSHAAAAVENDIAIGIKHSAGSFIIDATVPVQATQQQAWDVLTDYDHMTEYYPDLTFSKVLEQKEKWAKVEQKGKVAFGFIHIPFDVTREIDFLPYTEIKSRAVSGNLKKGLTVITLTPEKEGVKIIYHSEAEPKFWLPFGIGMSYIKNQTLIRLEMMKTEILRRKMKATQASLPE